MEMGKGSKPQVLQISSLPLAWLLFIRPYQSVPEQDTAPSHGSKEADTRR